MEQIKTKYENEIIMLKASIEREKNKIKLQEVEIEKLKHKNKALT